ncbi:hypothetical protein KC19_4G055500 [Ceratodon purpureus]|uniref:Uncharacterized protein n=1 Tax=Ceratodon purpureus TaxID=3225 RepID=A0A8T0I6Z8_CERPU|nr:hypothetical protein KC19_4G055500 [Ceratodon purpureus]
MGEAAADEHSNLFHAHAHAHAQEKREEKRREERRGWKLSPALRSRIASWHPRFLVFTARLRCCIFNPRLQVWLRGGTVSSPRSARRQRGGKRTRATRDMCVVCAFL